MENRMTKEYIDITPSTKVGDMLDNYPELEETLIGIAPPFKKLKNPFLRKTVAKVATLKHIASVGNVPLNEGEIIELTTTFLPAPGIDRMKSMGYSVWTVKEEENLIKTYFLKNKD
jgi:hypothetical protein